MRVEEDSRKAEGEEKMIKMYKKTQGLTTKISVYGGYDIKEELKELGFKFDGSTWSLSTPYTYDLKPLDTITEDDYWDDKYPTGTTCKWAITPEYAGVEDIEKNWQHYKKVYALLEKYLQK